MLLLIAGRARAHCRKSLGDSTTSKLILDIFLNATPCNCWVEFRDPPCKLLRPLCHPLYHLYPPSLNSLPYLSLRRSIPPSIPPSIPLSLQPYIPPPLPALSNTYVCWIDRWLYPASLARINASKMSRNAEFLTDSQRFALVDSVQEQLQILGAHDHLIGASQVSSLNPISLQKSFF